jgi:hypothetical protein
MSRPRNHPRRRSLKNKNRPSLSSIHLFQSLEKPEDEYFDAFQSNQRNESVNTTKEFTGKFVGNGKNIPEPVSFSEKKKEEEKKEEEESMDDRVERLKSMGFTKQQSKRAIEKKGTVRAAFEYLMTSNKTISNETISNETISNETISNETKSNFNPFGGPFQFNGFPSNNKRKPDEFKFGRNYFQFDKKEEDSIKKIKPILMQYVIRRRERKTLGYSTLKRFFLPYIKLYVKK